jgi:hypothetical protein
MEGKFGLSFLPKTYINKKICNRCLGTSAPKTSGRRLKGRKNFEKIKALFVF